LIAFGILTVLSVGWVGAKYVNVGRLFDVGSFGVTVQLAATGGLYSNSSVTYNGVEVGYVREVVPGRHGVTARLRVDDGTRIPGDVVAEVHSTSPVGEQYIDLKPRSGTGPVLAEGANIPEERTVLPTSTKQMLNGLNAFFATVPQDSYRTVVHEVGAATNGSGPGLRALLSASRDLLTQARENVEPTIGLANSLAPFLGTQTDLGPGIQDSVRQLAALSDQLVASDKNIRGVLEQGPGATKAVDHLVDDLHEPLPMLLANLAADTQVLRVYIPNLRQTLVLVPPTLSAIQSALAPYQDLHAVKLNFRANVDYPPYCRTGYTQTGRDPSDLSNQPQKDGVYCKAPPGSQLDVRGVRNNPCPNSGARSPDAEGCGLRFEGQPRPRPGWSDETIRSYDTENGAFTSPDGRPWQAPLLGATAAQRPSDTKSYLLWPVS
jgi:phospholipid/cholesterol/gamma-HCH transport system substrate-binding protein